MHNSEAVLKELNDAAESHNEIAFTKNQVHLTSNRMFVVKKRTNQIFIYKYNATGGRYEQGMWALEKDLSLATQEDSDFIRNIAPSMDSKRLAIAYPENVTILEETSPDSWAPITVVAPLMLEPFVNASSLYDFGHDALSLSKDGRTLTSWSVVVTAPRNEENQEYQPALVAAFHDEGEEWCMIDQQHELIVSPVIIFEHPLLAASGDVVAVQAYGGNGSGYNRKELVHIYDYNLATNWALSDTVVEPFHSELRGSVFGQRQSKAFSYDGSVLAIGALNQKLLDHRFDWYRSTKKVAANICRKVRRWEQLVAFYDLVNILHSPSEAIEWRCPQVKADIIKWKSTNIGMVTGS
jgi:hypothetical protein